MPVSTAPTGCSPPSRCGAGTATLLWAVARCLFQEQTQPQAGTSHGPSPPQCVLTPKVKMSPASYERDAREVEGEFGSQRPLALTPTSLRARGFVLARSHSATASPALPGSGPQEVLSASSRAQSLWLQGPCPFDPW